MALKPHARTNPKGVEVAMKLAKALKMRAEEAHWQDIADECGYSSKGAAYNAVQRELAKMVREPAEHLVQIELEKLRAIESSMLPKAVKGGKSQVKYALAILRVMERRSKLLGLDDFERRSIELAERQHSLDQTQSALVYDFMNRVLNRLSLTEEQRALVPGVVADELARITDEQQEQKELEA